MTDSAQAIFEATKESLGHVIIGLGSLQWGQLPSDVTEYLQGNPGTTTVQLACLLTIVVSGIVASPVLLSLGFGAGDPSAGHSSAILFESLSAYSVQAGSPLSPHLCTAHQLLSLVFRVLQ